jgi:tRNA wybutosine-synthesizing protein 1
MLSKERIQAYEKSGYRIVGNHSAVKICHYCKKSMTNTDVCYKKTFYGINSWRCVQMSPTFRCDHRCVFCWRDTQFAYPKWHGPVDPPKEIIDGCIYEHIKLLQGFGGNKNTDLQKFKEMKRPMHFAISLTGEPLMYPKMPEFIDELTRRKYSSFLVTNGTIPEMVKKLTLSQPTQLYISVYGPNEEVYKKTTNSILPDAWEKLHKSLEQIKHFKRSVVRLTLTKGFNLVDPKGYAEMMDKYKPKYLECKGFAFVGHSRERLEQHNSPSHQEINEFALEIERNSSYKILSSKENSSVVLLAKEDEADRIMEFQDSSGQDLYTIKT